MTFENFKHKNVIVTGHTGFKGSWLSFWLNNLGAKVIGISNEIPTNPSNFKAIRLNKDIKSLFLDIRDLNKIKKIIKFYKPDYIFHLAAQPLVRKSYNEPLKTFSTNAIGTLNVLESLKVIKKKCTVILITSDKSYKNLELKRGYRENDILGGVDPYSASKASAEIIIQSYFHSYFKKNKKISIGVARAGNVIGGGDWSEDRLVPDCVRSWARKKRVVLRNPFSTRPWQHVLEAVGGYLMFAKKLNSNQRLNGEVFNFGPFNGQTYNVLQVMNMMKKIGQTRNGKFKKIIINLN